MPENILDHIWILHGFLWPTIVNTLCRWSFHWCTETTQCSLPSVCMISSQKSYCFNSENLQIPIPTAIIVRSSNNITLMFHLARIFWGSPDVDHETYWSVWSCAPIHSALYFSWLDFHLDAIRASNELSSDLASCLRNNLLMVLLLALDIVSVVSNLRSVSTQFKMFYRRQVSYDI